MQRLANSIHPSVQLFEASITLPDLRVVFGYILHPSVTFYCGEQHIVGARIADKYRLWTLE